MDHDELYTQAVPGNLQLDILLALGRAEGHAWAKASAQSLRGLTLREIAELTVRKGEEGGNLAQGSSEPLGPQDWDVDSNYGWYGGQERVSWNVTPDGFLTITATRPVTAAFTSTWIPGVDDGWLAGADLSYRLKEGVLVAQVLMGLDPVLQGDGALVTVNFDPDTDPDREFADVTPKAMPWHIEKIVRLIQSVEGIYGPRAFRAILDLQEIHLPLAVEDRQAERTERERAHQLWLDGIE